MNMIDLKGVEQYIIPLGIHATVNMNDGLGIGIDTFRRQAPCLCEPAVVFHLRFSTSHLPQHAVGSLVAYFYPSDIYIVSLIKGEHLASMGIDGIFHLAVVIAFPGRRDGLTARSAHVSL